MLILLVFLNIFSIFFFKRNFIFVILLIELLFTKIYFCLICKKRIKLCLNFIFLILAACGSVIGISIIVKISRSKKNIFLVSFE